MDRRLAIADAAISLLATEGSRGLTHRAVDALLKLPKGSTSYYYRTREALIAAAVTRIVELDRGDLESMGPGLEGMVDLLEHWLKPEIRPRLTARFELFLMRARAERLGTMAQTRAAFRRQVEEGLAAHGVRDPTRCAAMLIAIQEGLLLDELIGAGVGPAGRAEILRRVFNALGDDPL